MPVSEFGALEKLDNFLEPQFSHLQKEDKNSAYCMELFWGMSEKMHSNYLAQHLAEASSNNKLFSSEFLTM